jgi:hypothetical protein
LLFAPIICFAQKLKEYKASNGITYNPADTIKISLSSMPDGNCDIWIEGSIAVCGITPGKKISPDSQCR